MLTRSLEIRTAYSRDSSGLRLVPQAVARPESQAHVREILKEGDRDCVPITIAGSQTSTTGSSICDKGILLSTRNLTRVVDLDIDSLSIRVEPGVLIGEINKLASSHGAFFAPDPTSANECSIGGAIACNASGPRSLIYGPTRKHVRSLKIALIDGRIVTLKRSFQEKNTVGYFPAQDPIDWFIGSEGTLGMILEAELALQARPQFEVGIMLPFRREIDALNFVVDCRRSTSISPRCLEYFDQESIHIVRLSEIAGDSLIPVEAEALVYAEFATDLFPLLDNIEALVEKQNSNLNEARVLQGDAALRTAHKLRHAVPAAMLERASKYLPMGGRRISTDWSVPFHLLPSMIAKVRDAAMAANVSKPVIFGHAGNGHPHCNYIGRDAAEVEKIELMLEQIMMEVISVGGTIAAEHGIGKIKNRWVPLQLNDFQFRLLKAIKSELDHRYLLAPGNIFIDN